MHTHTYVHRWPRIQTQSYIHTYIQLDMYVHTRDSEETEDGSVAVTSQRRAGHV